MKTMYTFCLALLLFFSTTTAFSQRIILELVKGSGPAPAYADPIPLTSAQYSFTNTVGSGSTASGADRTGFVPLVITKQVDGSTAALQRDLFLGAPYQYVRLNFYRADGSLGYRVVLGTAIVSNYSASAAEGCTSGCPALSESITIVYGQVATYDPAVPNQRGIFTWNAIRNREDVSDAIPQSAITQ